jgi:hypothetical protein
MVDKEASFDTLRSAAARNPWNLPFHREGLGGGTALNDSTLVVGDRSPTKPFEGYIEVGGALVLPVDGIVFPRFLEQMLTYIEPGTVATILGVTPSSSGSAGTAQHWAARRWDLASTAGFTSGRTITIAGGTGTVTLSAGVSVTPAVGRTYFVWAVTSGDDTTYREGYADTATYTTLNDTAFIMYTDNDGTTVAANVAGGTAVVAAFANAVPVGTEVTDLTDGVMTFSASMSALVPEYMSAIVYDTIGTRKEVYFVEAISATTWRVCDATGRPPANSASTFPLDVILPSRWDHVFYIHPTADLSSLVIQKRLPDVTNDGIYLYRGLRTDSLEIAFGGDRELQATFNMVGARAVDNSEDGTLYDADAADTVIDPYAGRLAQVAGNQSASMYIDNYDEDDPDAEPTTAYADTRSLNFRLATGLDRDIRIVGQSVRRDLPPGTHYVGATMEAYFTGYDIAAAALAGTEKNVMFVMTQTVGTAASESLQIHMPRCRFAPVQPMIDSNTGGVTLPLDIRSYKTRVDDDASACIITVTSRWPNFADA